MRTHAVLAPLTTAAAIAALCLSPLAAGADIITVDPAGSGDHLTIQAGLDAATDGDTVLVASGTYTGDGNRDLDFGTKNLVLESQSGASVTIIDAQAIGHRVLDFHESGQDTTCVIDGFTIRNGRASGSYRGGAGVRCDGASPRFLNCVFEGNLSDGGYGGAVFMEDSAHPVFRHCHFFENEGQIGGAIYAGPNCLPRITDCLFLRNKAVEEAGAVYYGYNAANSNMWSCVFVENESGENGGAMTCDQGTPVVMNCTYIRNTAGAGGGALHMTNGASSFFTSCTFVGNEAPLQGGCVMATETTQFLLFTQCIFAFTGPCDNKTIYKDATSIVTLNWCCSYGNAPGDNLPASPSAYFVADPLFCDVTADDLTLAHNSPCLPGNNSWGWLIGSRGEGCTLSPIEERSWGQIKAMYR